LNFIDFIDAKVMKVFQLSAPFIREVNKKSRFPGTKKSHGTFISKGIISIMGNNYVIQN
jgi:hypothetical protein